MEINYKSPEMRMFGFGPRWDVLWSTSESGYSNNEGFDNDEQSLTDDDTE